MVLKSKNDFNETDYFLAADCCAQFRVRRLRLPWFGFAIAQLKGRSSQSQKQDNTGDLPILSLCELVNNPDKYTGQVVRVSTTLSGFIHGSFVYDPNCVRVDTNTAVFFNAEHKDQIQRDLTQARGSDNFLEPLNVIAVGKFNKVIPSNESDTVYDTASLQFEILRIESASKAR